MLMLERLWSTSCSRSYGLEAWQRAAMQESDTQSTTAAAAASRQHQQRLRCCLVPLAGEYQECLRAGITNALVRLRDYDMDTKEGLSQELAQAAEFLDQAARLAMAAMLQVRQRHGVEGVFMHMHNTTLLQHVRLLHSRCVFSYCCQGPVFDTDARRAHGPVLRWIDRLLKASPLGISYGAVPAVPKDAVGRTALLHLLRSNLEMFSVYVDRCYDRDTRIATGSFQVRCWRALPND